MVRDPVARANLSLLITTTHWQVTSFKLATTWRSYWFHYVLDYSCWHWQCGL